MLRSGALYLLVLGLEYTDGQAPFWFGFVSTEILGSILFRCVCFHCVGLRPPQDEILQKHLSCGARFSQKTFCVECHSAVTKPHDTDCLDFTDTSERAALWRQELTWSKWIDVYQSTSQVSPEVVHRPRSDSPLHFDSAVSEGQRALGGETLDRHITVQQIFFHKYWDCQVPKSMASRPETELKTKWQQKWCVFVRVRAFTYEVKIAFIIAREEII